MSSLTVQDIIGVGVLSSDSLTSNTIVLDGITLTTTSGSANTIVTGTAGSNGQFAQWNSNGDVIGADITTLSQATWEAGTDTSEALVSPAKVAAAVETLAPAVVWEKIGSTVTANNDAYIDFTLDATNYESFKIVFKGVKPDTDNGDLLGYLSPDSGTTIRNAADDYLAIYVRADSASATGIDIDTAFRISSQQGNAAEDYPLYGILNILYSGDSQYSTYLSSEGVFSQEPGTGSVRSITNIGYATATETHNLIRFQYDSGNIASGDIELWGSKV